MNILNLLTKEKHVAGIEISDSVVRIALLQPQKKGSLLPQKDSRGSGELILIEEPIAANIIVNGIVTDIDLLAKTLKTIWTKAKIETTYAIVAIPDDTIYSRIFSFPKTVEGARLSEAMSLAIGFQLPINPETAYLDWERTKGTPSMNEIVLSMTPRTIVQGYMTALEKAGIKTLALESGLASIARAIKSESANTILFSKKTPDGVTIFALKDGVLRFSRTLPFQFVPESKLSSEIAHIKMALEAKTKEPITEKDLTQAEIRDDYTNNPALSEPKSKWLIALGAMIRGNIPEGEDNLISLLPVGTEEAYAYQKAAIFAVLIRNITIGVSAFFVLAFLSAYFFMLSLAQSADRTITTLSSVPPSPDLIEKEARVDHTNALINTASSLLAQTPAWNVVLNELMARTANGIIVSSFSAPGIVDKMTLSGTAKDRVTLNQFKKSLQDSPMLTEVELPTANLEQRESIPFSVSFRFKDPSVLYYK